MNLVLVSDRRLRVLALVIVPIILASLVTLYMQMGAAATADTYQPAPRTLLGTVQSVSDGSFVLVTDDDRYTVQLRESARFMNREGRVSNGDAVLQPGQWVRVRTVPGEEEVLVSGHVRVAASPEGADLPVSPPLYFESASADTTCISSVQRPWLQMGFDAVHSFFNSEECGMTPPLNLAWTNQQHWNHSMPVLSGDTLYVGSYDGVYAYDVETQALLWSQLNTSLGGQIDGDNEGSSFLVGDYIYFGTWSGTVYALNKSTGAVVWNRSIAPTSGSPMIFSPVMIGEADDDDDDGPDGAAVADDDDAQVVFTTDYYDDVSSTWKEEVVSLDADDGSVNWRRTLVSATGGTGITSDPIHAANKIFVASTTGGVFALDEDNGDQVWHQAMPADANRAYVSFDGYLHYVDNAVVVMYEKGTGHAPANRIHAYNGSDGAQRWTYTPPTSTPSYGSTLTVVGTTIYGFQYLPSDLTTKYLVGINGANGAEVSRVVQVDNGDDGGWWWLSAANGHIYRVSSSVGVQAFNISTGLSVWSYAPASSVEVPAVLADNRMVMVDVLSNLYVFSDPTETILPTPTNTAVPTNTPATTATPTPFATPDPTQQPDPEACYAVADSTTSANDSDQLDTLAYLNRNTGATQPIGGITGNTGRYNIEAVVFQPNNMQLFAADANRLGSLNLVTGAFIPMPQTFGTGRGYVDGDNSTSNQSFSDVDGLSFHPFTYELYGSVRKGDKDLLIKINTITGAHIPDAFPDPNNSGQFVDFVEIGEISGLDDIDDIAFDPITGVLYGSMNEGGSTLDKLVTIDIQTGAVNFIGDFRLSNGDHVQDMEGLSFYDNGSMYGTTGKNGPTTNALYSIDKNTAIVSMVGQFASPFRDFEGSDCQTAGGTAPATPTPVASPSPSPTATPPTSLVCPVLDTINFESLPAGTVLTNQLTGITISVENDRSGHPDKAIVFDSANPTGGDYDLGTPNQDFGGPGVGSGGGIGQAGANMLPLGKLIIIAEDDDDDNNDGLVDDPDDEGSGGIITFDFDAPRNVALMQIVDVDSGEISGHVRVYDSSDNLVESIGIVNHGDNSVQSIVIEESNIGKLEFEMNGSGALNALFTCPFVPASPPPTPTPAPLPVRVIDGLMALYTFNEGSGSTVRDVSNVSPALDLTISDPGQVSWSSDGMQINGSTQVASSGPASKIINGAQTSNEITLEAWLVPSQMTQGGGGAPLISISGGESIRNVTLEHQGSNYHGRLRTSSTSADGIPMLSTISNVAPTLTHVVYTRDANGTVRIYINGSEDSSRTVGGNFTNWDANFALLIGNEASGGREWDGEFKLAAVYARALSGTQVLQNYMAGSADAHLGIGNSAPTPPPTPAPSVTSRVMNGLRALYTFNEGSGKTVHDVSGSGAPINLNISDSSAVSWVNQGLSINSATFIGPRGAATKLVNGSRASQELSVEAWVRPSSHTQSAPVVTYSSGTNRNFTLSQNGNAFEMRVRTGTAIDGAPTFASQNGTATTALRHVVYTRSSSGVENFYVDGVLSATGSRTGSMLTWDNSYGLGLGNEIGGSDPWLGEYHYLAIYNRALSATDVVQNFGATSDDSNIAMPIVMTVDPGAIVADGSSTATISALVQDATGNPVPSTIVFFETNRGTITESAVTNAQGIAQATITSEATVGVATVNANTTQTSGSTVVDFVEGTSMVSTPSVTSSLSYTETDGSGEIMTTVEVPAGAVTGTTTLNYASVTTLNAAPPDYEFAGQAFNLDAYLDGEHQPEFAFAQPIEVTIEYSDADVSGLDENYLILYYWDGENWVDAATSCDPTSVYQRDPLNNSFTVEICHLTEFGVFEVGHEIYMPILGSTQ